jgi:hypothetical protein
MLAENFLFWHKRTIRKQILYAYPTLEPFYMNKIFNQFDKTRIALNFSHQNLLLLLLLTLQPCLCTSTNAVLLLNRSYASREEELLYNVKNYLVLYYPHIFNMLTTSCNKYLERFRHWDHPTPPTKTRAPLPRRHYRQSEVGLL